MRRNLFITTLTCLVIVVLMSGCGGKKVSEGTILAEFKYGGEKQFVTLEELEQEISELPKYKRSKYQDSEGKNEYLTLMIESRLILELAKSEGLDKDPDILKKVEEYLHQLMVEKITEKEIDAKVNVTEDDLKQYYEEHKQDYVNKEQVKMACISLNDEELAQETFKKIQDEDQDMLELAKALSDDRSLVGPGANARDPGVVGFGRKVSEAWKPFVDASFELEVGDMYPEVMALKVQDQEYFLIFRKDEYQPEQQQPFDEVRKRVDRKVQKQKKKERMDEWVSEVRKDANLTEYPDRIPAPPEVIEEKPTEEQVEETETKVEEKAEEAAEESEEKAEESAEEVEEAVEEEVEEIK